ncbi:DUF3558 domain-containing protein [Actinoalloteichus hymeniacidonis]|uniref:DUF3558 family protein n=1 Tax=Actinoalloteichus hymeniacidonis TaxID=340345 RepID=A0AAC9HW86_9PSEU|nr:DUF3558 domain-containing protein [Actinoalloteichus hymeniacidonis]AOS66171.1 putative DUF3558 family protein [Actinoalloteichus hymeniacidonis]MBB5905726.1 hypothetical protein [Actinoalloteichus hymeniacidonis]
MTEQRTGLAIVCVVVGVLAGCSSQDSGSAGPTAGPDTAGGDQTAQPEVAPTDSAVIEPVSRPQDIDVAGVDSCTLLTEEQLAELGASDPPRATDFAEGYDDGCTYGDFLGDPAFSYVLGTGSSLEFDRFQDSPNSEVRAIEVLGYPASQRQLIGAEANCIVDVSPSEGQTLSVQYMDDSFEEGAEVVCSKAADAAGLALETLRAAGS